MNKIDKIENLNEKKEKIRKLPRIIGVKESLQDAMEREESEGQRYQVIL